MKEGEFKKRLDELLNRDYKDYELKRIYNWLAEAKKDFPTTANTPRTIEMDDARIEWFEKWFGE